MANTMFRIRRFVMAAALALVALVLAETVATAQQPTAPQSVQSGPPRSDPPPPPTLAPAPPATQPQLTPPINVQPVPAPASLPPAQAPAVQRFQFHIDPNTPVKDLLPPAPKVQEPRGPLLSDKLTDVPEVVFHAPLKRPVLQDAGPAAIFLALHLELLGVTQPGPVRDIALMLAKANVLNAHEHDGFVDKLRSQRPDLAGLPFLMGDACRTKGERSRQFTIAVATVRRCLRPQPQSVAVPATMPFGAPPGATGFGTQAISFRVATSVTVQFEQTSASVFWQAYQTACADEDRAQAKADQKLCEQVTVARIAALMQILAPESPDLRLGLVKFLSATAHVEATKALTRMAIFSPENNVRQAAIDALKVRRERDYTDTLLKAMQHPLPAASRNAAEAIVKLERNDLVPQLVTVLDAPDPRAPVTKNVDGKKVQIAREMVKINHHKSCLLCHSPGNTDAVSSEALTAPVPIPGEPLPSPLEGYGNNASPDLLVRIDVTYLRQDFSVMQEVGDAAPWPEMQRFDFLVRERVLSEDEAVAFCDQLKPREAGQLPPNHRAALAALRELTGKDTAPTAAAWREMLKMTNAPPMPHR